MGLFSTSKYRKPDKQGSGTRTRDAFTVYGGKIGTKRFNRQIDRAPLTRVQKEYVKQVMAKYNMYGSKGITREEFHRGLDEMAKNTRDPIRQKEIENIKEYL